MTNQDCEYAWLDDVDAKNLYAQVEKVDASLGLVLGFAIVCKIDNEEYFDVQGDHIPEDSMLKAAADFMANSRIALEMHDGEQAGNIVFAFPLTAETAAAMGITKYEKSGLMIAMKPSSTDVFDKFKSGEYTGFSIGGRRLKDEEVS